MSQGKEYSVYFSNPTAEPAPTQQRCAEGFESKRTKVPGPGCLMRRGERREDYLCWRNQALGLIRLSLIV